MSSNGTIVAPFNFVLKQLVKKYMNAWSFSGEQDGGKTALFDTSLSIHGHFEDKSVTEQSSVTGSVILPFLLPYLNMVELKLMAETRNR